MSGLGNPQRLAQTRVGQHKVMIGLEHHELLLQAPLALAHRVNTTPDGRHSLADVQVEPLDKGGTLNLYQFVGGQSGQNTRQIHPS